MKHVITMDGSGIRCLYDDTVHRLISRNAQHVCIERYSNIEWNHAFEAWEVTIPSHPNVRFRHESRQACLEWERRFYEEH